MPERPYFTLTARVELKRGDLGTPVNAPVTEVKKGSVGLREAEQKGSPTLPGTGATRKERDLNVRSQPIRYEPDESLMSWFA